ncbi:MAG: leucine-rich repeat domain-containing protein [Muribaculaceae bacterium]|nr:leucine-rich repeat domain-containing protein [Muribaculaceae bacterium]
MINRFTKEAVAALFSLLAALPASAYDFEVDGFYYNVISFTDLTCEVTNGTNSYSGDITIPDVVKYNGKDLKVAGIGTEAFKSCSQLDHVIVGNNVTTIGESAFRSSSVEEVALGENVTSIRQSAFNGCSSLAKITFNDKLKTIADYAFYSTTKLSEVNLPEGLESIGMYAFYGSGITSINIPSTVISLGSYCFCDAKSLTSVDFKGSMETIPFMAFSGTTGLASISIPPSVITIKNQAFSGSGIKELTRGDNVRVIEQIAFTRTKLVSIDLGPSLKELAYNAFSGSTDIRTVNCYAAVAPELTGAETDLFDGKTYIDGVLNVLVGAKPQYENASQWKNFWNIQPTIENTLNIFSFNVYATVTGGNGKVLINGEDAVRVPVIGDSPATFTFVPDFGCKLTELTLDGEDVLDKAENNSFKVEKITATTYLRATFTPTPVMLTIASGDQGKVTTSVPYGSAVDCTIQSLDGWKLTAVTFNGDDVTPQVSSAGAYTTPALYGDSTLAVSYISTSTGLQTLGADYPVNVLPKIGGITVTGASDTDVVNVFDISGRNVASTTEKEISLNSGTYIINVAGKTFKVIL